MKNNDKNKDGFSSVKNSENKKEINNLNPNFVLPISDKDLNVKVIDNAFISPKSIDENINYSKIINLECKNNFIFDYFRTINFREIWKTYSFNELVLYWQNNLSKIAKEEVVNKNKPSIVPNPEKYIKAGEDIFKFLENNKMLLLFQSDHIEPTICNVRNHVYREGLMLACFQDAIKIGMLDLGLGLTEYMSKHLLFPRYIYEWGFIKALIYENEDLPPRKLTDKMLQHLQDADFRERIRRFDMFEKELTPQIRPNEPDNLLDLKEASDWSDVQLSLKLIIAGSFGIRIKLNHWNKTRDYHLKDFGFIFKNGKLIPAFQKFMLIAFNGYYSFFENNDKNLLNVQFNKINTIFKHAFNITDDPIYYDKKTKKYISRFGELKIDGKVDFKHFTHTLYYDQAVAPDESPKQLLFNEIKTINEKYQSNEKLEPDEHQNLTSYWTRFIQPLKTEISRPSDNYNIYLKELEHRLNIENEFSKRLNND